MNLNGCNILITGASSGIGKAIAKRCHASGAFVHLAGRDEGALLALSDDLGNERTSVNIMDMRVIESFLPLIDNIVNNFGKINGFVHSAGYQITAPIQLMDINQYQDIHLVNVFSAFEICRILSMRKYHFSSSLSIVLLSSVMSIVANPGLVAYCSTKAALVGGARAMAIELAPKGIRVNCISPGTIIDTKMTGELKLQLAGDEFDKIQQRFPLGLGNTNDVTALALYLLSDSSRWLTGQNIILDGGYSAV